MSACTCNANYDFDKGDHDAWFECGFKSKPDAGAKCCECGVLLATDRPRETYAHYEGLTKGWILMLETAR